MLQQTQVDRVLPKYASGSTSIRRSTRWPPRRRPTSPRPGIRSATTSGRGGCRRSPAKRCERYGGTLPADEATLLSFKGIGAYTAGAIRSFAFRQRAAILDTNVARVLFRVFVGDGDPKSHAMTRHLWDVSTALVPIRDVFDFNQALMDFGAIVCVGAQAQVPGLSDGAGLPRVSVHARAQHPVNTIVVAAAVIERGGQFLVTRRQPGTHLAGHWEFPGGKCEPGETLAACLARELREELASTR